jgi:hypothetical protein
MTVWEGAYEISVVRPIKNGYVFVGCGCSARFVYIRDKHVTVSGAFIPRHW